MHYCVVDEGPNCTKLRSSIRDESSAKEIANSIAMEHPTHTITIRKTTTTWEEICKILPTKTINAPQDASVQDTRGKAMSGPEIYFSCDVESDGPIPGPNSMLSFGVAAFVCDPNQAPETNEKPIATFEANLALLPSAVADPKTMEWWNKPEQKAAWESCRRDPKSPQFAMRQFVAWVDKIVRPRGATPVLVAYPSGYDFTFLYWYMVRFAERSPFSFSALDIKTFAMATLGTPYRDSTKKSFPARWIPEAKHTHVALEDAIEQGIMFLRMLAESRRIVGTMASR
jgi:hypothetical protein